MSFTFKQDTPRFCVRCGAEADLILRYDVAGDEHGEGVEDYEIEGPLKCEVTHCGHSLIALHADITQWLHTAEGTRDLVRTARGQMAMMGPSD